MPQQLSPLIGSLAVGLVWLAIAALALIPSGNAFFARRIAFPLGALAGLALAGFGVEAVWFPAEQMTLPLGMPDLPFHLRIDPLAGFFLLLLVTGPVSRNMEVALKRTYEATPEPKLVVAIGDCGCDGGVFGENYASCGRVANVIPVDVAVPGCPPDPSAIIRGILTAVSASRR